MYLKKLLIAVIAACLLPIASHASENYERALAFLELLDHQKVGDLEAYLADDVVFEDPTFGAKIVGKSSALKMYAGYAGGSHNVKRLLMEGFESGNAVVTTWVFSADSDPYLGAPAEHRVPIIAKIVRTLEFNKDGQIIRQLDLGDYSKIIPMIMAAQEKYADQIKKNGSAQQID